MLEDSITVHIDYSSMPRSWYCKLPILLEKIIRKTDKIYFWYTEGDYPASHEEYPSSGIDAFSFFRESRLCKLRITEFMLELLVTML